MTHQVCGAVTLLVWVGGYAAYALAVIQQQTKPSLGFWFTISVVDYVMLAAVMASGVHGVALMQIMIWVVGATLITILACFYQSGFALNRCERVCLTLALLSMLLWVLQHEPRVAVVIQVIAMAISSVPMWQNALRGRERWQPVAVCMVGSALNLGALPSWSWSEWPSLVVPVVAFGLNLTSTSCARYGRRYLPPAP